MKQTFICEYCGKPFTDITEAEKHEAECWERLSEKKAFGDRLATLRIAKGLSQGKLANKAGVEQGYISLYEADKVSPTIVTLQKLCVALEITATDLLGY